MCTNDAMLAFATVDLKPFGLRVPPDSLHPGGLAVWAFQVPVPHCQHCTTNLIINHMTFCLLRENNINTSS